MLRSVIVPFFVPPSAASQESSAVLQRDPGDDAPNAHEDHTWEIALIVVIVLVICCVLGAVWYAKRRQQRRRAGAALYAPSANSRGQSLDARRMSLKGEHYLPLPALTYSTPYRAGRPPSYDKPHRAARPPTYDKSYRV